MSVVCQIGGGMIGEIMAHDISKRHELHLADLDENISDDSWVTVQSIDEYNSYKKTVMQELKDELQGEELDRELNEELSITIDEKQLFYFTKFQFDLSFKNLNKIFVLFVLLSISSVDNSYAQAEVSNGYNPLSLRQVHESYLMWKRTLWRRIDMKEKQNKPFFALNRELSRVIIDAVERGVLIPYTSDTVDTIMPIDDFRSSLVIKEDIIPCNTDINGCNNSGCPGEPFFEPCEELKSQKIDIRHFSIFQIKWCCILLNEFLI